MSQSSAAPRIIEEDDTQRTTQERCSRDRIAMALVYRALVAADETRGSDGCDLYATERYFRASQSAEEVVTSWHQRLKQLQVRGAEPLHLQRSNRLDLDW